MWIMCFYYYYYYFNIIIIMKYNVDTLLSDVFSGTSLRNAICRLQRQVYAVTPPAAPLGSKSPTLLDIL